MYCATSGSGKVSDYREYRKRKAEKGESRSAIAKYRRRGEEKEKKVVVLLE